MVASNRGERQKAAMAADASPPKPTRAVAVFCGSRFGADPHLTEAARAFGAGLAAQGIGLVYGGGSIGLMTTVADAVLAAGGHVLGVIPEFLARWEVAHQGLDELLITDSMHSRKQAMFEHADAFVTLPGGFGTLDETVEIITWRQLRLHDKPVFIVNINGWADAFLGALRATVTQEFAAPSALDLFEVVPDVAAMLDRLTGLPHRAGVSAARL